MNPASAAVTRAVQVYGRIDILVNNAGRSQRSLAEATPWSVDRDIMDLNYTATVALTKVDCLKRYNCRLFVLQ
jgi:short-subunit dehydrogenase